MGKAAAGDQLPPGDATVLCLLVHSADSGHAQQGLAAKGQHRFQRAGAVHRLKGSGGILWQELPVKPVRAQRAVRAPAPAAVCHAEF